MIRKASRFLNHMWKAKSAYGVHSPFVYEFVTQVLPHHKSEAGNQIDAMRREMARDQDTQIRIEDFGAGYGGKSIPVMEKTLAQVVKSSARGRREGELLHRICAFYEPQTCLELGTNLGFSTMYQASALPESRFISMEGAESLAAQAQRNFANAELEIEMRVGEFGKELGSLLEEDDIQFDYVFLDGNHRYEPTIAYFECLLPFMKEGSMLILDDINWSREMEQAWAEIVGHPEVTLSLDLFFLGIAFIRRPQAKQHFLLRFLP